MPVWCEGIITDRTVWTQGLFTLRIRVPEVHPFLPGQFLQLGLHVAADDTEPTKLINRPYSVASPHNENLEFFIVVVEEGELTPRLWDLQVGDLVQVSQKGAGSFTLQKAPPAENLWLLATGTGLAPYIAMVRDSFIWQQYRRIFIVHGVRVADDLAYTDELRQLEMTHPDRFRLFQTLTRDQADGCLHGRIPQLIEDGILEDLAGIQIGPENTTVMLCGNPAMLDSMEELLATREMRLHRSKAPGQIVLERYW